MKDDLGPRALVAIGTAGQFIARVNAELIAQASGEPNPLPTPTLEAATKALDAISDVAGIVAQLLEERP